VLLFEDIVRVNPMNCVGGWLDEEGDAVYTNMGTPDQFLYKTNDDTDGWNTPAAFRFMQQDALSLHDTVRGMANIGFLDGHVEYLHIEQLEPKMRALWSGGAQEDLNPTEGASPLYDTVLGAAYWHDPVRINKAVI
jgi:prepilin-type processing-associated H-X9-DG protein